MTNTASSTTDAPSADETVLEVTMRLIIDAYVYLTGTELDTEGFE